MKNLKKAVLISFHACILLGIAVTVGLCQQNPDYQTLLNNFKSPDYAEWGEVPLWWWEADSLNEERITWQMETLAEKGVKSVNPIQRSPARTYPASFTDEWWEMIRYTSDEADRLGMHLWLYDQIGYGHYGWLEKAAAEVEDTGTSRIEFLTAEGEEGEEIQINLPEGKLLDARGYPIRNGNAVDESSVDLSEYIDSEVFTWTPDQGKWKVAISIAVPYKSFYLNEASTDVFLDRLYNKMKNVVGENAMGESLRGVFQDEHPPIPRDIYTEGLAQNFENEFGYDMSRAIPALHFDVGDKTPKYRTDFFDVYLSLVEKTYWEKVYDWSKSNNILTSHDNWGRKDIYNQSVGYIDYFRTQRWFSAPGMDDAGQFSIQDRNYYDSKIAASIARLYDRERVWAEAFHTSGWGRTTNQTLSWLSTLYTWGNNLYDEHGLYYSVNASTWEHAAPDPHFHQPYWEYYQEISDWVARTSYMISQGDHVSDVAVHYPVISVLSDLNREEYGLDYNTYMELSRIVYNEGIDNDIIDDQSILNAEIVEGKLRIADNEYQALVFGPESTFRLSVLNKITQFVEEGGAVLFYGHLPKASAENGRNDEELAAGLASLLGVSTLESAKNTRVEQVNENGGYAAFVPHTPEILPSIISSRIERDLITGDGQLYYQHRSIGDVDVYMVQNTEDRAVDYNVRFRVDGVPEIWDPFTGEVQKVDEFQRKDGYTRVQLELEGNVGKLLVFKPGDQQSGNRNSGQRVLSQKELSKYWTFSVIPTRDNQWGAFRWPPSNEKIGPEIREFQYIEDPNLVGLENGWHMSDYDDSDWESVLYSKGPYWLSLQNTDVSESLIRNVRDNQERIEVGRTLELAGENYKWEEISFSQTIGLPDFASWGGHSGYPDGHIDRNYIQLEEGEKLLFTRIYSPSDQRVGLNVELRNSYARLWVNNQEEPFQGAVGNLPLNEGYNSVLLYLPDGTGGRLYVQREAPTIQNVNDDNEQSTQPDLIDASWIWSGNSDATYLRKTFNLDTVPEEALVVATGLTGFILYVNGQKVEEEIGPWVDWDYPERIDIQPYLREGKNVIAAQGQYYSGQHYQAEISNRYRAFSLAMKGFFDDGSSVTLESDETWKGHTNEFDNWQSLSFKDSEWENVSIQGEMGDEPWGDDLLDNIGSSTTPYRPLSVNLTSPYIVDFEEVPEVRYDVKRSSDPRIGWYRFEAPPGLSELDLNTDAQATVWVNGNEIPVNNGIANITNPPLDMSSVVIRLDMKTGAYAGAAFKEPIGLKLEGGRIQTGSWTNYGLPTYSGIGVYKQTVEFSREESQNIIELDLVEVAVATELFVNGKSAGVRVAAPFKFNISEWIRPGKNEIEVRVANTIAPHYKTPRMTIALGPTISGLLGPVSIKVISN